ncbi:hypothetical protein GIB67_002070 [Kingdonia uniflora]|uniref:Uncharacterized protein n=1 Tax=Kingdonia uniflora TaxID=39325 RepID=A0A7J7KWB3_9MAGN|nr:hypothetical protein GIB67_002070 [Kingdonia uniflora]
MEFFFRGFNEGQTSSECTFASQGSERCPFLRNINEPTNFSFSSPVNFAIPVRGAKGPIFEDGPNFDMAFSLFHGHDGVVPLSGRSFLRSESTESELALPQFNPLAARAASIGLSTFGMGGLFGFDAFSDKWKKQNKKSKSSKGGGPSHEALGNEWLQNGKCPIAKSFQAVNRVLPLVAKVFQPPPGMKFKCPPAIVAARAALARTALVKTLRPQTLPTKMLAIGAMGMAVNIPLGVWREHTEKFSPSWFIAIHAAVPFIAMLRKSVVMPKTAMALTIAASILGQVIGSRAERIRLQSIAATPGQTKTENHVHETSQLQVFRVTNSQCSEITVHDPLGLKAGGHSASEVCY